MATIRRFSGRTSWMSLAAFGLSGCLTALAHGAGSATQRSSAQGKVSPNYYMPSASGAENPKSATTSPVQGRSADSRTVAEVQTNQAYVSSAGSGQNPRSLFGFRKSAHELNHNQFGNTTNRSTGLAAGQHIHSRTTPYLPADNSDDPHQHSERNGLFGRVIHRSEKAMKTVGTGVMHVGRSIRPIKETGSVQNGTASWYGTDFHGGRTASGERYDMNSMTAAHRTLPFGTVVKVRNLNNGRECLVRINNRGPFIKGRILDMSKAAARELGFMGRGLCKVQMQVLGKAD